MNNNGLILFPLVVMFLLAIVSVPGVFTSAEREKFWPIRSISENTCLFITEEFETIFIEQSHWWPVHAYDMRMVYTTQLLDNVFGFPSSGNQFYNSIHHKQADELVTLRDDTDVKLDNMQVYEIIKYDPEVMAELEDIGGWGMGLSDTLIFIGILIGLLALAALLGLRIFSSGLAGTSISLIFRFVAFFLLWAILSTVSMNILTSFPLFGAIIWMVLTLMYTLGILLGIQSSQGED